MTILCFREVVSIKNEISGLLIIHNEAKVLSKCLAYLRGLLDELVVVHDGVCHDGSLEIVKRFFPKAKIFSRCFVGVPEAHRWFGLRQCSKEWVLSVDADELVTHSLNEKKMAGLDEKDFKRFGPKEARRLKEFLSRSGSIVGYRPFWVFKEHLSGDLLPKHGLLYRMGRVILFKRLNAWDSGIVHEGFRLQGKWVDLPSKLLTIVHDSNLENPFNQQFFEEKIRNRMRRSATLKHYGNLNFGRASLHLVYLCGFPLLFFIILFELRQAGWLAFRAAVFGSLNFVLVNWYSWKIETGRMPSGVHSRDGCEFKYCSFSSDVL